LSLVEVRQVHPYPEAQHRYLHVWSKVMETPSEFPRRPGMAAKRPLGRSA
jgi:16S rRNA (guanine527-N7)-methyltransferase